MRDSEWGRYQSEDSESDNNSNSDDSSDDRPSAHLHEYARRHGPHEDSDSVNEKYNISEEEGYENAEVHNGDDNDENSSETPQRYSHHPYARDYQETEFESQSHEKQVQPVMQRSRSKSCKKQKKTVYVYKQPPIVVRPKATNVYIKSKPIVVQPPPLVVHHAAPKPCNPIIKYQPPNIKLKPVIVKISKPRRTTTTTTTPCPSTTKKPCRKCRRKPTKKCNRCSRRRQHKSYRPDDFTVYYNPPQNRGGVMT